MVVDCIVGAGLLTFVAFPAFIRRYVGLATSNRDCTEAAGIHAISAEVFLSVVCDDKTLERIFCTGTVKYLYDIVVFQPAAGYFLSARSAR